MFSNKKWLFLLSLFLGSTFCYSQAFLNTYGQNGTSTWGCNLTVDSSGNFLVAGFHGSRPHMLKTDPLGNVLLDQKYNINGSQIGEGFSAFEGPGNNIYTAGKINGGSQGGQDFLLVSVDQSGNPNYAYTYGTNSFDRCYYAIVGGANEIIMTGRSANDVMVVSANATTGAWNWSKRYNISGVDAGWNIHKEGPDYTISGTAGGKFFLMKIDATGNELWTRTYDSGGNDFGSCHVKLTGGGYVLAGSRNTNNLQVIKTDAAGNVNWSYYIPSLRSWQPNWGIDLLEDSNGDVVIAAETTNSTFGSADGWVLKLDATTGNVIWSNRYDNQVNSNPEDGFHGIAQVGDCGYIATGWFGGVGSTWDYCLVKIDINGVTGCEVPLNITPVNTAITFVTPAVTPVAIGGGGAANITIQNNTLTPYQNCFGYTSSLTVDIGNDTAICGSITLDAGYPGANYYVWSTGDSTQTITVDSAGQYIVEVNKDGCLGFDTINITINSLTINLGADTAVCSSHVLDAAVSGGTYTWSTGDTTQTISVPPTLAQYWVQVTDSNGCTAADTIVVDSAFLAPATITTTDITCFGYDDGTITINTNSGQSPFQYSIDDGGTLQASNNFPGLAAGTYIILVEDSFQCITKDTVSIAEPGQVQLTVSNDTTVCEGNPGIFSASAIGGNGGPYTYYWNNTQGNNTYNFNGTASNCEDVYAADANGCFSDTQQVCLTVIPTPVTDFSSDVAEGCEPLTVTFFNNSSIMDNSIWNFGDGSESNTQDSVQHTYTNAGSYDVTLTITHSNGCSNSITKQNYIEVHPNPVPIFASSPNRPTELDPEVWFNDLSVGNVTWWDWQFHSSANTDEAPLGFSNEQNPTWYYPDTGDFAVTLTVTTDKGCTDDTTEIIRIYPHGSLYVPNAFTPNNDGINDLFNAKGVNLQEYQLLVYDRWGEVLYETNSLDDGWDGQVNNKPAPLGVYVYQIKYTIVNNGPEQAIGSVTLVR